MLDNRSRRPPDAVLAALFGRARAAVIGTLFSRPDRWHHLHELVRETGASVGSVQRELKLLLTLDLVERRPYANLVQYRPNRGSTLYRELHTLAEKTFGIEARLRAALQPLASGIAFACIYGSVAAGTTTGASDVDVMVVGEVSFADVIRAAQQAADDLHVAINPAVYDADEFIRRRAKGEHFVTSVLASPYITLFGSPDVSRQSRQDEPAQARASKPPGNRATGGRGKARPR